MTYSVNPDHHYQRAQHLRWRREVENVTLYDTKTREMKTLNPVAALIWELLDGFTPVRNVIETVRTEFSASADKVNDDIINFLKELLEVGYITQKND